MVDAVCEYKYNSPIFWIFIFLSLIQVINIHNTRTNLPFFHVIHSPRILPDSTDSVATLFSFHFNRAYALILMLQFVIAFYRIPGINALDAFILINAILNTVNSLRLARIIGSITTISSFRSFEYSSFRILYCIIRRLSMLLDSWWKRRCVRGGQKK